MGSGILVAVTSAEAARRRKICAAVRAHLASDVEVLELDPDDPPIASTIDTRPRIELIDAEAPWRAVERRRQGLANVRYRGALVAAGDDLLARELRPSASFDGGWVPVAALLESFRDELRADDPVAGARQAVPPSIEFLSRMSHELRTPLNAILGFAQLLELDDLTRDQRESVEHIIAAGRHLLALVNETLDISRVETGRMSLSLGPIVASDAVQQVLERVRQEAVGAGVSLACANSEAIVLADRERLLQVLYQILVNAVRYNRPGGSVTVDLVPRAAGRVRVVVRDTGPGIPLDRIPRLFTPFDRLGAEPGKVRGTGLGLMLAKRLVEAMSGEIGVESEVGVGSAFWVELPALPQPEETTGDTGQRAQASVPPHDPEDTAHAAGPATPGGHKCG